MDTLASHKNFNAFENIYFIGIGGIGMSALARYFYTLGKRVAGYDKTQTSITKSLENEGVNVHYNDCKNEIPTPYCDKNTTLVVYTPAIPEDFGELKYFKQMNFTLVKRSEVLGLISKNTKALCVAGTHGKTTTSALLAHILQQTKEKCTAFIGGIASNYNTNVLIAPDSQYTVIEADEFDRSFLRLTPFSAIITSTDPDHLDIYTNTKFFEDGFINFASLLPKEGHLIVKYGLSFLAKCSLSSYAIEWRQADYYAQNLRIRNGQYVFDFITPLQRWENIKLGIGGRHNINNAIACMALCDKLEIPPMLVYDGVETFKGVKRRFEVIVNTEKLVYIDDYAHHPTELKEFIDSVKELYPHRKIIGIFQPHLFSRTRDFFDNFVRQLSRLDELVLMPIYPAREKPIDGINSEILLEKVNIERKQLLDHSQVIEYMTSKKEGVFLTMGAGDIDRIVEPLKQLWGE